MVSPALTGVCASNSMSKGDWVISKGRFKGKRVTFAPTARVEEFADISCEFMEEIFDLRRGDYAISDESDIRDFICGAIASRPVPFPPPAPSTRNPGPELAHRSRHSDGYIGARSPSSDIDGAAR